MQRLLRYDTKSSSDKRKNGQIDFIKIPNLSASKDTIEKVKRQATNCEENIWKSHIYIYI